MTPLLLLPLVAHQIKDQANVAILAETRVMRMAGMPAMPELPAGVSLPEGVPFPGKPTRHLSVQLWAPKIAPKDAYARLVPPSGLNLGSRLDLELTRPEAGKEGEKEDSLGFGKVPSDFQIKLYWGSSDTVREGQPKIVRWSGLTADQKAQMRRLSAEGAETDKAEWTNGTWPTGKQTGAIKNGATLPGTYTLNTNFTGDVVLDVPRAVDFLPAIQLSSPRLEDELDLAKPLAFKWAPLPTTLGQFATAFGMEGKNTMILWMSSESYQEGMTGIPGFLEMAEVRDFVKKDVFMAAERSAVTIPAGIFKNAEMAMLNLGAWGPGVALAQGQPLPRLQTKSTLTVMLGGKGVR